MPWNGLFIIEHPTRGTLRWFISNEEYGFSLTGMRNDPEKTMHFFFLNRAEYTLRQLPERLRKRCVILEYDGVAWKKVD